MKTRPGERCRANRKRRCLDGRGVFVLEPGRGSLGGGRLREGEAGVEAQAMPAVVIACTDAADDPPTTQP